MRVYLDDERETPEGWHRCYWPEEVIELLKTGEVKELSLDHDLGTVGGPTGYDVVTWFEEQVLTNQFPYGLPRIRVHSQNPEGRRRMLAGIQQIISYRSKNPL